MYKLPWTDENNGLSWIEVTHDCNITCHGCYRKRDSMYKGLDDIQKELDILVDTRKSETISLAGGEPLLHPCIVEIVKMVTDKGCKATINTNGILLTKEKLIQLKEAGLTSVVLHIDSSQSRGTGNSVIEDRELLIKLVNEVGDINCNINQTVSDGSFSEVIETIKWAENFPELIDGLVFVCFRNKEVLGNFEYYKGDTKIDPDLNARALKSWVGSKKITTVQINQVIMNYNDRIKPAAKMVGTVDKETPKWLFNFRLILGDVTVGSLSSLIMKLSQIHSKFFRKKWSSYLPKKRLKVSKLVFLLLAIFDPEARFTIKNIIKEIVKNPKLLFKKVKIQSIITIQPMDIMEDGQIDTCESCIDMTMYNGKLVKNCQLQELKEHGTILKAKPKK